MAIRLSGKRTTIELTELQRAKAELVQKRGAFRLLVMLENFQGSQQYS